MKHCILFLTALILITNFCKSQITSTEITGNYTGQSTTDRVVITIEVKQNHEYVLTTYDSNRKLQKEVKGEWTLNEDKLVLIEKSGLSTVLQKYKDTWYIADKNGRTCLARFYQNKDQNEFWADLMRKGC